MGRVGEVLTTFPTFNTLKIVAQLVEHYSNIGKKVSRIRYSGCIQQNPECSFEMQGFLESSSTCVELEVPRERVTLSIFGSRTI
jgi:hypothetical protein